MKGIEEYSMMPGTGTGNWIARGLKDPRTVKIFTGVAIAGLTIVITLSSLFGTTDANRRTEKPFGDQRVTERRAENQDLALLADPPSGEVTRDSVLSDSVQERLEVLRLLDTTSNRKVRMTAHQSGDIAGLEAAGINGVRSSSTSRVISDSVEERREVQRWLLGDGIDPASPDTAGVSGPGKGIQERLEVQLPTEPAASIEVTRSPVLSDSIQERLEVRQFLEEAPER